MTGPRLSIIPGAAAFDPAVSAPMYRLLGVLAARADKHGRCFPSISKIAKDMNIGERWINRLIGRLLETQYLTITHRPGHSTVYQIKGVVPETTPGLRDPWSERPPTPGLRDHPPLVSGTTHKDTTKDTKKDTSKGGEFFERFWAAYPDRTPHPHPKKPARILFLAVLKKGADPEAIIRGAENYAAYIRQEGKEPRWIKGATAFLNQEYWTGYQTRPKPVFKAVL